MQLNQRADILRDAILTLAAQNKPKSKYGIDIWKPYTSWEYEQLNVMRLIYGRLYEAYQTLSECFGWSLIIMLMSSLCEFVSKAFWSFEAIRNNQMYRIIFNSSTVLSLTCLVSLLLLLGDEGEGKSRNIGCLIFKLVKPLGNKRYNDLVSEFSLQTLHQRFVITAKEFFNLNLNLLGSMVAAIVTYLVILIQFMLSEGTDQKHPNTTNTTVSAILSNISYNFSTTKVIENVFTTALSTEIPDRI
ncbi:gustatory receptor 23a-like [Teleopsis dalmanni]|uniref:gustatory receptor 23a-like n=1 Tax=Teleopsis dalmanni TaxID=139649 RepID=UPI0018CD5335|nr:gustatory receptor 23a-like [Teleopsis dalmanni]